MEIIQIGDRVRCNRDLPKKGVTKGQEGVVEFIIDIQSENYLDVRLDNDKMIETSSENCWSKTCQVSS